jgi:GntR family transcriptional regulator
MPGKGRFRFHVFPSSGVPLFRQLIDQVLSQIGSGRLSPGDFLPPVRQVAQELQVNPMTVSKAYSVLEHDGIVELVRPHGMRVKAPISKASLKARREQLRPLLEQVAAQAYQLSLTPEDVRHELEPLLKGLEKSQARIGE